LIIANQIQASPLLQCPSLYYQSDGSSVCKYHGTTAMIYSAINYDVENLNDSTFARYDHNCTHFASQVILAGFTEKTTRSELYALKEQYSADKSDIYSWFYQTKWQTGNAWKEAHSLYLYAKYSAEYDPGPVYLEAGPKFKYVTEDSQTAYMDHEKIKVGDIIFSDYEQPQYAKKIDGHMDHVYIVTKLQLWRSGYDAIRVSANSEDHFDKSLGEINLKYKTKINFTVFRPIAYVSKVPN